MYNQIKNEIESISDPPEPLSVNNIKLLKRLERTGFRDWTKTEFAQFISAAEKFGHDDYEKIHIALVGSKTYAQIKAYS